MKTTVVNITIYLLFAVIVSLSFRLFMEAVQGGSPFDTWKLTSPGRMELVGTAYYFSTLDGNEFTAHGPGYQATCWTISACKYKINSYRKEKKEMGL